MPHDFSIEVAPIDRRTGAADRRAAAAADGVRREELRQAAALARLHTVSLFEFDEHEADQVGRAALTFLVAMRSRLEAAGGELDLVATFVDGSQVALAFEELRSPQA